jgi:hypothetical protein
VSILADDRLGEPRPRAVQKALELINEQRTRADDSFHVLDSNDLALAVAINTRAWVLVAAIDWSATTDIDSVALSPLVTATTIREMVWANEPAPFAQTTPPPPFLVETLLTHHKNTTASAG